MAAPGGLAAWVAVVAPVGEAVVSRSDAGGEAEDAAPSELVAAGAVVEAVPWVDGGVRVAVAASRLAVAASRLGAAWGAESGAVAVGSVGVVAC